MIKFNQKAWLKLYIDMNTDLRKKDKEWLWNIFFKLMNNAVFKKTMENVRKHRNIQPVTTERSIYLLSEPNYHTAKFFTETLLAIEMKKQRSLWINLSIQDFQYYN